MECNFTCNPPIHLVGVNVFGQFQCGICKCFFSDKGLAKVLKETYKEIFLEVKKSLMSIRRDLKKIRNRMDKLSVPLKDCIYFEAKYNQAIIGHEQHIKWPRSSNRNVKKSLVSIVAISGKYAYHI